jgi:predicted RecB family nuclease
MNSRPHLDKRLQFDFLINTIRPRKRYNKWLKAETDEVLEIIQEYHGYSIHKARQVLNLFNDSQIDLMRKRLNKGGKA